MNCDCAELPDIFNIERHPNELLNRSEIVAAKDRGWRNLNRCLICGELWQIDLTDRLQVNCAIRVRGNWENFDDKPIRVQHLIESRGGFSDEICVIAGCSVPALRKLAYCAQHAYEVAGLRE